MGKIKVIFLDVDGVLNSDRTARRTQSGYTLAITRTASPVGTKRTS